MGRLDKTEKNRKFSLSKNQMHLIFGKIEKQRKFTKRTIRTKTKTIIKKNEQIISKTKKERNDKNI